MTPFKRRSMFLVTKGAFNLIAELLVIPLARGYTAKVLNVLWPCLARLMSLTGWKDMIFIGPSLLLSCKNDGCVWLVSS